LDVEQPPARIDLEVCNFCNYNCVVCTTGNGLIKRPRQFLTLEGFKQILAKLDVGGAERININCIGEPFLNPEIYDILDCLERLGKTTHLPTNASLLDPERLQHFSRLQLKVSLDSTRFEAYHAYRRTTRVNFDRALANIRRLAELEIPFDLTALVTRHNQDHLDEIQAFADELGVQLSLKPIICSPFGVTQEMLPPGVKVADNWVGRKYVAPQDHDCLAATGDLAERFSKYRWDKGLGLYVNPHELSSCPFVRTVWICADGQVLPCCFEAYYSTVSFGNIFDVDSLRDIWLSPEYLAFRRGMLDPARSPHPACRICTKS
jgi:MoaA/NifB/PqqE/SkfB family radical SAM enzyme